MTGYTPKVGDKVRATLGENVLVGEVAQLSASDLVELLLSEEEEVCLSVGQWQFEQVVSVPSKFGAVIRRNEGGTFSLTARRQKPCPWLSDKGEWVSEGFATEGGFTILFDGVDE